MFVPEPSRVVPIEPSALISAIVVDPLMPTEFLDEVKSLVAKYGEKIPVERSTLYDVGYLAQMLARERAGFG